MAEEITRINSLDVTTLFPFREMEIEGKGNRIYGLTLLQEKHLSEEQKSEMYELFRQNMENLAEGTSLETDEEDKREELFHPDSRLFCLAPDFPGLTGFAAVRFDMEDTAESLEYADGKKVQVLYIYELQVDKSARGQGFGAVLLRECEALGKRQGMKKTMLTCLKKNVPGLKFYAHHGYKPDEIDPTLSTKIYKQARMRKRAKQEDLDANWMEGDPNGKDECDYRILSKVL